MSVLQMQMSTSYANETQLEATHRRTQRIGTAGDSRSSQHKRGERSECDLTVCHGWPADADGRYGALLA